MLLTNMFRTNNNNLTKKEEDQQNELQGGQELADILQNKTKPATTNVTLAVDDEAIVVPEDGQKKDDEQAPLENKKSEEELEEIFTALTAQNHLVSLVATNNNKSKTAKIVDDVEEKKEGQLLADEPEKYEKSEVLKADATATKENHKPSSKPKFTAWLRASLGTAAQVLTEAQPSVNVSAAVSATTPMKDAVAEKQDIQQEEPQDKEGLSQEQASSRKVAPTGQNETKEEAELTQKSTEVVPETVEEVHNKEKAETAPVVEAPADDVKEEAGTEEDNNKEPSGDSPRLTKGAQAAADSISLGAENASRVISNRAKRVGDKAKDLNKDGTLTNIVAAAAILGAGIGAAVLGSAGTVDLESTVDEDLIKMMD